MASAALHAVRLYRMDLPDHVCPWGFRAVRLLQDRHIPFEDHRLTIAEEVEAFKAAHGVATTPQVFSGDERIGGYSDLAVRLGVRPEAADITYAPVVAVFLTASLMALVLAAGVSGFMGFAICLLAMLKLMDVEAFATSFRKYDLHSQRLRQLQDTPRRGEFRGEPDHGRHGSRDARRRLRGLRCVPGRWRGAWPARRRSPQG